MWCGNNVIGLFPSPKSSAEDFELLGSFIARAILDLRLIDASINEVFVDALLGRTMVPSIRTLRQIDPILASSLAKLQDASQEALAELYFVHPSFPDIELCSGGASKAVTPANFDEFRECLLRSILEITPKMMAAAFKRGFDLLLNLDDFSIFTAPQFLSLINGRRCNAPWDPADLMQFLRIDHGYARDDPQIQWLAETFSELLTADRRNLIKFITGAVNLPSGGWSQLDPPLTVVLRPDARPDATLPSVMTCANYLKLPRYSSKAILKDRLLQAIQEGQDSFLLS